MAAHPAVLGVVEAVLGKKTVKGKPQFLLKWRGYPASEATWSSAGKKRWENVEAK